MNKSGRSLSFPIAFFLIVALIVLVAFGFGIYYVWTHF